MRTMCIAAVCALLCSAPLFAGGTPDGGPRLRPQDARIKAAIAEGVGRSATFKALVDRLRTHPAGSGRPYQGYQG